jgi:mRNA-degrading endonuclease HigB of HigAB toxin-antitoxin module
MEVIGKSKLEKLKRKNRGNITLCRAIDDLLHEVEAKNWINAVELKRDRPDADLVHGDGFYFFNIAVHRTMVLMEFEENGEATIIWCGTHDDYELTFKNNKTTIEKWLKGKGLIN